MYYLAGKPTRAFQFSEYTRLPNALLRRYVSTSLSISLSFCFLCVSLVVECALWFLNDALLRTIIVLLRMCKHHTYVHRMTTMFSENLQFKNWHVHIFEYVVLANCRSKVSWKFRSSFLLRIDHMKFFINIQSRFSWHLSF